MNKMCAVMTVQKLKQHPLGFWELTNKPIFSELAEYYADKYYQEAKGSYEHEYTTDELRYFQVKLEQRLEVIRRYNKRETGRLLDVGCGEGYTLAFFKEKGWSVKGIDFSSAGIESKNPECLSNLVTGDIFNLLKEEINDEQNYNIIWLQNVLEHVIDPIELLGYLRSLISPEGMVVVTVPNDCSITQLSALKYKYISEKYWVVAPDHLNYFNYESLLNIAEATGWKCKDILADFPIDWYLFHPGSNYISNKNLGKSAHKARVQLENIIHEKPIDDVINFWSALAKVGFGRDITAFLMPKRRI